MMSDSESGSPWASLVWFRRSANYRVDITAGQMPAGPSIETVYRGVFNNTGGKPDLPFSLLLFEAPASSGMEAETILTDPLLQDELLAVYYCGRGPSYGSFGTWMAGSVLRPLPCATPNLVQWQIFDSTDDYRAAVADVYEQGDLEVPAYV